MAAIELYAQADRQVQSLRQARQVFNDLVHRAPYFLRWYQAASDDFGEKGHQALSQLFVDLKNMTSLLAEPHPDRIPAVRSLATELAGLRAAVESS